MTLNGFCRVVRPKFKRNLPLKWPRRQRQWNLNARRVCATGIRALTQVQTTQGINPRSVSEADVIALHLDSGQACVQVFFIRANQNWGNRDFYPRVGVDVGKAEALEAFMGQFYDGKEPPRQIILSDGIENIDLMVDALSGKAGRKVEILVPQRGEKAETGVGRAAQCAGITGAAYVRDCNTGKIVARCGRSV